METVGQVLTAYLPFVQIVLFLSAWGLAMLTTLMFGLIR
jgi:hypothetical protein